MLRILKLLGVFNFPKELYAFWFPLLIYKSPFKVSLQSIKFSRGCHVLLLQEGVPFQGPRVDSSLTLRKMNCQRRHTCWQSTDFIGKGHLGREPQGKGTQQSCFATWLIVLCFMVLELVSRLSLASLSDSVSFLVVSAWLSEDGFQRGGFWVVGRPYGLESPLFFWPCLNSSSWWYFASYALLIRTSCPKISVQVALSCLPRAGSFSRCFP